jgi:hypothetical protein
MTLALYTKLGNSSVKLIAKFGKTVDLFCQPLAAADANKPWRGPNLAGEVRVSPKGLVTSFTTKEINGERIKDTDVKLLVAPGDPTLVAAGFDIKTLAFGEVDGVRYGAIELDTVKPADLALLYTIRLRLA